MAGQAKQQMATLKVEQDEQDDNVEQMGDGQDEVVRVNIDNTSFQCDDVQSDGMVYLDQKVSRQWCVVL